MLGDLLCAVPAFRALRAALPDANITLIGLPWAVEFARQYVEYFDDFIEFPGFPGLPERAFEPSAVARFLIDVQSRQFDLAIQMHGSGSFVNPLVTLFGARRTAGYFRAGEYCPDCETFLEYPGDLPEVRRHLRLAAFLGAPPRGEQLEFPLTAAGDVEARKISDAYEISPRKFICLHPGARYPSRRWPAAKFAAVANSFAGEISNVVITGTKSESPLADELISHLRIPAVNLIGRTDLGTLAWFVHNARLLVSGDTGVAHLAAAVETPSVVVVLSSDVERWAPLDERVHRTVVANVDCRPCEFVECPIGHVCAAVVEPEEVIATARIAMDSEPAGSTHVHQEQSILEGSRA